MSSKRQSIGRRRVFRNCTEIRKQKRNYAKPMTNATILKSGTRYLFRIELEDESYITYESEGPLNIRCDSCSALHFKGELTAGHFTSCCHDGLIFFPQPRVHEELKQLILHNKNFVSNIRSYNSSVAFASMTASQVEIPGTGPYCFKIQGQIYRYISDLIPRNHQSPSFGQLYIIDSSLANDLQLRRSENDSLETDTLQTLSTVLSTNPYVHAYQRASDALVKEDLAGGTRSIDLEFVDSVTLDARRYNRPSADEIAGVFFQIMVNLPLTAMLLHTVEKVVLKFYRLIVHTAIP